MRQEYVLLCRNQKLCHMLIFDGSRSNCLWLLHYYQYCCCCLTTFEKVKCNVCIDIWLYLRGSFWYSISPLWKIHLCVVGYIMLSCGNYWWEFAALWLTASQHYLTIMCVFFVILRSGKCKLSWSNFSWLDCRELYTLSFWIYTVPPTGTCFTL